KHNGCAQHDRSRTEISTNCELMIAEEILNTPEGWYRGEFEDMLKGWHLGGELAIKQVAREFPDEWRHMVA
ncbi:hypothetical protein A2U01_0035498, partial [Trifolium medium]|nr:hypothetical protein [Trifolium medium]